MYPVCVCASTVKHCLNVLCSIIPSLIVIMTDGYLKIVKKTENVQINLRGTCAITAFKKQKLLERFSLLPKLVTSSLLVQAVSQSGSQATKTGLILLEPAVLPIFY